MIYISRIKYLLIFFVFCHYATAAAYQRPFAIVRSALQEAARQNPDHLARIFSRVITHGCEKFNQTSPLNHHKHMHHNSAVFWPTSDTTTTRTVSMPTSSKSSQLLNLHQELDKRFESLNFKGIINPLLVFPKVLSASEYANYQNRASYLPRGQNSFVTGHQRSFYEYELDFPLVVTSFFDLTDAKDKIKYPNGKLQKWYAPIEQSLLIASKKQYINDFAILDGDKRKGLWGDYSEFAIALLPAGTTLYGHFGVTASQINDTHDSIKQGGASQFYIAGAKAQKEIKLINIDALDNATGEINFVKSLVDIGLIYPEESDVFYKLRNGFKEYYDVYEKEQ
jgi:hypothetical protein